MGRLIWKEFRERRLWILLLPASTVLLVLAGKSYTFLGDQQTHWTIIPTAISLLMGAGVFSSETSADAASFLYSRPVSWKKVLLAKLTAGFAAIVGAAVLAAVIYRLVCPQPYVELVTPPRLIEGVGLAVEQLGIAYVLGLACSVALPGVMGGALMALALFVSLQIVQMAAIPWLGSLSMNLLTWLSYSWMTAAVLAAALTIRFGLTLPLAARVRKYLGRFALIVAVCAFVSAFVPESLVLRVFPRSVSSSAVSPDGRYALLSTNVEKFSLGMESFSSEAGALVRLSDGRVSKSGLPWSSLVSETYWANSDTFLSGPYSWSNEMEIRRIKADLTMSSFTVKIGATPPREATTSIYEPSREPHLRKSPDGRYMMVASEDSGKGRRLEFADVLAAKKLKKTIDGAADYWWQSNTEIGWGDQHGKRQIVRVTP